MGFAVKIFGSTSSPSVKPSDTIILVELMDIVVDRATDMDQVR